MPVAVALASSTGSNWALERAHHDLSRAACCSEAEQVLASGQAAKQLGELNQAWVAFVSRLSKEVQGSTNALLRHCACALVACGLYNCQTLDTLIKCGPVLPDMLLPPVRHSLLMGKLCPRGPQGGCLRPAAWRDGKP